ncbi:hypothetical protein J1614_011933 [Plenodomus biglobosus]|nr:hypothetical protein J1614_011933 [Plenodomus biglobosus]
MKPPSNLVLALQHDVSLMSKLEPGKPARDVQESVYIILTSPRYHNTTSAFHQVEHVPSLTLALWQVSQGYIRTERFHSRVIVEAMFIVVDLERAKDLSPDLTTKSARQGQCESELYSKDRPWNALCTTTPPEVFSQTWSGAQVLGGAVFAHDLAHVLRDRIHVTVCI